MNNDSAAVHPAHVLGDFREVLVEGVCFRYRGYYANGRPQPGMCLDSRWQVERVVERGVVVSHPSTKGHQHLLEWNKPIAELKFGAGAP